MPAAAGTRPWGPDEGQFRRDTRRHAGSGSGLTVAFRLTLTLLCQERVPGGHIEPSPCPPGDLRHTDPEFSPFAGDSVGRGHGPGLWGEGSLRRAAFPPAGAAATTNRGATRT